MSAILNPGTAGKTPVFRLNLSGDARLHTGSFEEFSRFSGPLILLEKNI